MLPLSSTGLDADFFVAFALIVSLLVGSFLNVVIHRLPHMMERGWKRDCCELLEVDNSDNILIDDLLSGQTTLIDDTEEILIAELARLTTLLSIYEEKEQYEKAKIIENKIKFITNKLNNL